MRRMTQLHPDDTQALFLNERFRLEGIRDSLSMPVAEWLLMYHEPRPCRSVQRCDTKCPELSEAGQAIAAQPDLPHPPRRLMIDEEKAVILAPGERITIDHHDN